MATMYSAEQAYKMAVEHFQAGRFAEAELLFRQLVAVYASHEALVYAFAMTCYNLGKNEDAVVWLRKTLEINPAHTNAHINLGIALTKLGQWAEAEDSLHKALTLAPDLLPGWDILKQVAARRGDWQTVLRSLERLVVLSNQEEAYIQSACSEIYQLVNDEAAAIPDIFWILREGIWSRPELYQLCLPLLQNEVPEEERDEQISLFNQRIEEFALDGWGCLHLALLWRHLFDLGWYSGHAQRSAVCQPGHVEALVFFSKNVQVIGSLLRYKLDSPREWNARLFRDYILPLIRHGEEAEWLLFPLDVLNAFVFQQQPHTEEQARYCFAEFSPAYIAKGALLGRAWERSPLIPDDVPVIAFYAGMALNYSAPFLVISRILTGWHDEDKKSFIPLLIGFGGIHKAVKEFLDRCRIEYVDMEDARGKGASADILEERINALHEILRQRKVSALLDFAGSDGISSLIAASGIAPVQVYYSMGYHYMDGPGWDAFFCFGSAGESRRIYEGRPWRTIALSHLDPRNLPGEEAAAEAGRLIKAQRFPKPAIVLGAIARPQKLDSDEFLAALASVLKNNDNAVFLWFGSEELDTVRQKMIALGISGQCLFEGFQSTITYAQVLDIHLDPFPFPSGLSILDTMCYGVPSVFMDAPEGLRAGVPPHIFPLLRRECGSKEQQDAMHEIFTDPDNGESLALLANSADEYAALLQRLIDDPVFRGKAGRAGQRFMEAFMLDPKVCYESFSRQILEVIEEKKAAEPCEGLA